MSEIEEPRSSGVNNQERCQVRLHKLKRIEDELFRVCNKKLISRNMLYAPRLWLSHSKSSRVGAKRGFQTDLDQEVYQVILLISTFLFCPSLIKIFTDFDVHLYRCFLSLIELYYFKKAL